MEEHGSLLANPRVWVAVAFVIFFVVFGRKLWAALAGILDARTNAIRAELAEAIKLRKEAEAILREANQRRARRRWRMPRRCWKVPRRRPLESAKRPRPRRRPPRRGASGWRWIALRLPRRPRCGTCRSRLSMSRRRRPSRCWPVVRQPNTTLR